MFHLSQYNPKVSIHALLAEGDKPQIVTIMDTQWFLSTPSSRRATVMTPTLAMTVERVSIHALREEGDVFCESMKQDFLRFLSTPSARRAT